MNRLQWFFFGAFSLGAVLLVLTWIFVLSSHGFSARERPSGLESWLAQRVRSAAIPRDARALANPAPDTPEVQTTARAHWADHCAGCHGNDGSGEAPMGRRTYPPAPDMRLAPTQQMTDGELFYIIQNGIRMSAMPAWGSGSAQDEQDSWKLVRFIRHLPNLTWDEKKQMERMNPKSPDEIREEQEEEKFLKGEGSNEPQIPPHHH
jgi:mono/diheme cytochrome c family protein